MKTGPMLVGHEPTVTVAATLVAPLQASVQSAVTARVSPGPRLTGHRVERAEGPAGAMGHEVHDHRRRAVEHRLVLEAGDRDGGKVEGSDADSEHADRHRVRRAAAWVTASVWPTATASGLGVGVGAPEQADSSTRAAAASQKRRRLDIVTILGRVSAAIGA